MILRTSAVTVQPTARGTRYVRGRDTIILAAFFAALAAIVGIEKWSDSPAPHQVLDAHNAAVATAVRAEMDAGLDRLAGSLDVLSAALNAGDRARSIVAFRMARAEYKRTEFLVAVYSPPTAAALNGPAPESDGDTPPPPLGAPAEFQQIESVLFEPSGANRSAELSNARATAVSMRDQTRAFRLQSSMVTVGDAELLDAVRAQIARVSTIGIAGVDTNEPRETAIESAAGFDGMIPFVNVAASRATSETASAAWTGMADALRAAATQLRTDPAFSRTSRLAFIITYIGAAARSVTAVRAALPPPKFAVRRTWRTSAASVFDSSAFDPSSYAPEFAPRSSAALVALGKRLFFDPRLSGPQTRSCASCHDPSKAFTDGRTRAQTLNAAAQPTARNTPTLINAAFEPTQFADQRAGSLEEQVARVLSSAAEMQSSDELVAMRLQKDSAYRAAFTHAIPMHRDTAVTALGVRIALAAYMRTLVALNSRFDRAVRGDSTVLSAPERRGFELFVGKARCASCHFMPLFSGVAPPEFVAEEPEVIGVPAAVGSARLDADPGRGGVDHIVGHNVAFKVPTLRNVALTAPYMHNGVFKSLEEVVDFYDRGGGAGLGIRVPNQTLGTTSLHLRADERHDLIAFLGALTDTIVARAP
jgi:cytochrome c peroxidase